MKDTITEEEQIEQILEEANAYNLRQEVITTAETFIKDDPELDKIVAYEMGYMEWVKQKMKTVLEFLIIGILFMLGTIVIAVLQLISWLWEGFIRTKEYLTTKIKI